MQALLLGANLYLESRFDPETVLRRIQDHRLDRAYLVPTMFSRMLKLPDEVKRRYDLSSMKFVMTMGSPCAPEVKRAMIDWWGPVIHESYAASELGLVAMAAPFYWLRSRRSPAPSLPLQMCTIVHIQGACTARRGRVNHCVTSAAATAAR